MIKSYKVKLLPNNRQKTLLSKSGGTARWAYNFCLARQKENYDDGGTFISDGELRKEITQLKKTDEYDWLGEVSAQIPKQAIKGACHAFKRFLRDNRASHVSKEKEITRTDSTNDMISLKF